MDRFFGQVYDRVQGVVGSTGLAVGAAAAVCVPTTCFVYSSYMHRRMRHKMDARGQRSRKHLEELKKELETNPDSVHPTLVELSFRDLKEVLQTGEITAAAVLRAYQAQALKVNSRVNGITDPIQESQAAARQLDESTSVKGPLHGIPISVKESIGLQGQDCTAGFGELIDIPMENDSVLVQVLKLKGAIPFIRTNLPQGMRSLAGVNPIWGETVHPQDATRTSGGSSSGEAAIIGGGGSVLGVGSDIGGSIRIPASFCGICGLKPTAGRLSSRGNFGIGTLGAQKIVPPTDGPMGRDVTTLVEFMDAVLCQEQFDLDPTVPPVTFRREIYESKKPLKIGYYVYDGTTHCVPAVERAVLMAKATLQTLGHKLVEIKPYNIEYAITHLYIPAIVGDDGVGYKELRKYDNSDPSMKVIMGFHAQPYLVRWMIANIHGLINHDPVTVAAMKREALRSVNDWYRKTNEAKAYVREVIDMWRRQGLDAVICPVLPCVATKKETINQIVGVVTYTAIYNLLNFPAGVLPVTKVTKSDESKTMNPSFYDAKTRIEKMIQKDSEGTEGRSVGVQVVSLPYNEEVVLRVMSEIENGINNK